MPPESKHTLIVTTSFGLEAVVRRELEALGFSGIKGADGRLEFDAVLADIPRLNLWLHAADCVLLKLGEFPAVDFGELFDRTKGLPWEAWIPADAKITVAGKSFRSKLASVRSAQSIVKKAVIERLRERLKINELPETGAEFTVQAAVHKDTVQLTLDTTGAGLHKRGYRLESGELLLRENVAAALVLLSFWRKGRLLIDPMCGSGTVLIEAARLARNMAPGLKRKFAAENWPALPAKLWEEARRSAAAAIAPPEGVKLFGYDVDPGRVKEARANARRAGVGEDIIFEVKDIRDLDIEADHGIVITNPPWGVKLMDPKELDALYLAMDSLFREKPGWSVYVLTADSRFPQFFRRGKPDKVRKLYNGTIETNFYQYYGTLPPK